MCACKPVSFVCVCLGEQWVHAVPEAKPAGNPEGGGEEVPLLGGETLWTCSVATLPSEQGAHTCTHIVPAACNYWHWGFISSIFPTTQHSLQEQHTLSYGVNVKLLRRKFKACSMLG